VLIDVDVSDMAGDAKHAEECPPTPPSAAACPPTPERGAKGVEEAAAMDRPGPALSPESDQTCAICLSKPVNPSCTDVCAHKFCFVCLKEWSQQRAVCPLCKTKFKVILHDIVSDDNYQQFVVPAPQPEVQLPRGGDRPTFMRDLEAYHRHLDNLRPRAREMADFILPAVPEFDLDNDGRGYISMTHAWNRRRGAATSDFRRDVYSRGLFVEPASLRDPISGRYREASPQWYRNNQAQTHRLVGWLNRELNALMDDGQQRPTRHRRRGREREGNSISDQVVTLVLELVQRYEITSPDFHQVLEPYLGLRTAHFQHEFNNYARCVYDIVGFDRNARYSSRTEEQQRELRERMTRGRRRQENRRAGDNAEEPPRAAMAERADPVTVVLDSSDSSSDGEAVQVLMERPRPPPQPTGVGPLLERLRDTANRLSTLVPASPLNDPMEELFAPFEANNDDDSQPSTSNGIRRHRVALDLPSLRLREAHFSSGENSDNENDVRGPYEDALDDTVEVVETVPPRRDRPAEVIDLVSSGGEEESRQPDPQSAGPSSCYSNASSTTSSKGKGKGKGKSNRRRNGGQSEAVTAHTEEGEEEEETVEERQRETDHQLPRKRRKSRENGEKEADERRRKQRHRRPKRESRRAREKREKFRREYSLSTDDDANEHPKVDKEEESKEVDLRQELNRRKKAALKDEDTDSDGERRISDRQSVPTLAVSSDDALPLSKKFKRKQARPKKRKETRMDSHTHHHRVVRLLPPLDEVLNDPQEKKEKESARPRRKAAEVARPLKAATDFPEEEEPAAEHPSSSPVCLSEAAPVATPLTTAAMDRTPLEEFMMSSSGQATSVGDLRHKLLKNTN